jgi:transposase
MAKEEERFYLGIDIGRHFHVAALVGRTLFEARPSPWEKVSTFQFATTREGFDRLSAFLESRGATPQNCLAAMEPTGGYYSRTIFAWLRKRGYGALWVKNQAVHDQRETLYGRRSKSDVKDARLIARLLYLREVIGQEYAFLVQEEGDPRYKALRLLVGLRWKHVQERRRAGNQLMQILDVVFPELRLVFRKSTVSWAPLHLLKRFPTSGAISEASEEELYEVVVGQARSLRHQTSMGYLKQLAATTVGLKEETDTLVLAAQWLVEKLLRLEEEIKDMDQRIARAVEALPETAILRTFPYMSSNRIAVILAAMGAPIEAFHSDRALRKQLGWYVEEEHSGTSLARSRLGRSGNRASRRELRLMAMNLITPHAPDGPFKAYYRRLTSGPKPKLPKVALGHLASKIISVMYVCMKRKEAYDELKQRRHIGLTSGVRELALVAS